MDVYMIPINVKEWWLGWNRIVFIDTAQTINTHGYYTPDLIFKVPPRINSR